MACSLEELQAAACASGIGKVDSEIVLLQLIAQSLCGIASGGICPSCENLEGESSPLNVVTPDFVGQTYVDGDGNVWQAGSLLSSSWTEICTPGSGAASGVQWGPDPTELILETSKLMSDSFLDNPSITSITFSDLVTIDDEGSGQEFAFYLSNTVVAYSFPELVTASVDSLDGSSADSISSWSSPKLETVRGDFLLNYNSTLTFLDVSSLETVGGTLDILDNVPLATAAFPSLISVGSSFYAGYDCPNLTSVSAPLLESVGDITVYLCPVLASVSFPVLDTHTGNSLSITDCAILASVSLPLLVTVGNLFVVSDNPMLTTVNLAAYLPTNGETIDFTGCALSVASVNHILARAIASAGYVSGTIDLSGGTNATPTGQGIADKAALILRGVTVTTN